MLIQTTVPIARKSFQGVHLHLMTSHQETLRTFLSYHINHFQQQNQKGNHVQNAHVTQWEVYT
jgi:hypothetical protein